MLWHAERSLLCIVVCSVFLGAAVRAQPAISDVRIEAVSHGTVTVRFQVHGLGAPTDNWVEYGPSHLLGHRTAISRTPSSSPHRSLTVGGLRPDTEYYFRPMAAPAGGDAVSWYCGEAGAGPAYACDGPDAPAKFRTAADPAERPVPPAPPETTPHPFPEIDGETFTVSVDERSECVDLQTQLERAAAADPDRNHEVVIPAGATCYGEHTLPRKLGPGVVVVRPSTPLERLPPPGVRIDPSYSPLMATLSAPPAWSSVSQLWRLPLSTPPERTCEAPCTEGWRLVGLEITHPAHDQLAPRHATIESVAEWAPGRTLVTLDREMPLDSGQWVAISGIEGESRLNGVHGAIPVDSRSFVVRVAPPAAGASGGLVLQALSIPIESCSGGPQPVCRTRLPHGLTTPAPVAIRQISGRQVETGEPGQWPWMTTVEVEGSSTALDGIWGAHRSGGGVRLVGTPDGAETDCAADCGQVRLRPSVQLFGFDEAAALNGSRLYSVISETELRLDDIDEATPPTDAGFLSADPGSFPRLVALGTNARNIVLDRCWIHGQGFPTRLQGAVALSSDDSALLDSVVSDIHSWRPVNPAGGSAEAGFAGYFAAAATVVTLNDASRVEIRNNLFHNCVGITVYAEMFRSTPDLTPSDIVIQGNTFRNDDLFRAGAPGSNGRYYGIRHAVEFKRGQRIRIEGNVFNGNWADWTPLGPVIGLLPRAGGQTPNNRVQDVSIRNNVFRRVSTAIQISGADDRIEHPSLPTARIAIENNWFQDVDFYRMRSRPSGVALLSASTNFGGRIVMLGGSLEDISIRHNTAIDNRGKSPAFFWYQGGRGSGVAIIDNVVTHNDDSWAGGLPRAWHASEFGEEISGQPSAAFTATFTQTPGPDPHSRFARNLVLPGVRDSSSPAAYDDPAPASNFTKADCEEFYAGFPEIECAGSGTPGETANERFRAAFPNLEDPRDALGRGADLDALRGVGAEILDASMTIQDGAATVRFRTDSPGPCIVDLAAGDDFTEFQRAQADSGSQRSAVFEGVTDSGPWRYRIQCASQTVSGSTTAP